ncbi:MAG: rhomboid family intramembrane serine protease [Desulfobacteraceae bacterium]|nr:rhomboid family intramembrane serine protease [Desulfobacteraceae bacterium]
MNTAKRKSLLCPNCRKLVSADEPKCPYCGIQAPGAKWKNNPLTKGWGSGEHLVKLIIYVNVGMYVLTLLLDPKGLYLGLNPLYFLSPSGNSLKLMGATGSNIVQNILGWRTLISANYLHGSILHIFFNLVALNQLSPLINQLFGPYRFFLIFTVSGVVGFYLSCLMGIQITIGASAALCGLIGAALYYGKSRGGLFGQAVFKQIGGWAIYIVAIGFLVPIINNTAHIGGMAAGVLTAMILGYNEKSRETMMHRTLAGVCMVLTALILAFSVFIALVLRF